LFRRDPLQYLSSALLWIDNRKTGLPLDAADLLDNAGAFVQQRDDASVERVDLGALSGQRLVSLPECMPATPSARIEPRNPFRMIVISHPRIRGRARRRSNLRT
jgi:hypothetical protein